MRTKTLLAAAVLSAAALIGAASAADIKIGVIYPLSGNAANAGRSALAAVQLAADIINTPHPDLSALPAV
jgi:branched-chain amino acid transport system substrate-binding protein